MHLKRRLGDADTNTDDAMDGSSTARTSGHMIRTKGPNTWLHRPPTVPEKRLTARRPHMAQSAISVSFLWLQLKWPASRFWRNQSCNIRYNGQRCHLW